MASREEARRVADKILKLRGEGLTLEEIAGKVNRHITTVGAVLRTHGLGARDRPTTLKSQRIQETVEGFFADPQGSKLAEREISKSVAWQLLKACMEQVTANHLKGREWVEAAIDLFALRIERATAPALRQRWQCLYVVSRGLRAACLRRTSKVSAAKTELLHTIERDAKRCPKCQADLHRRLAYVHLYDRSFGKAYACISEAMRLYGEFRGDGHDLHGKPREKCLAARATICMYSGRFEEGERDASDALSKTSAALDRSLHMDLLVTLTWCQLRLPGRFSGVPESAKPLKGRIDAAKESLSKLLAMFDSEVDDEHSVPRATAHWLAGVVDGLEGNREAARFKLGIALEDYQELEMSGEVVVCAADKARFEASDSGSAYIWANGFLAMLAGQGLATYLLPFRRALAQIDRARLVYRRHRVVPLGQMLFELRDFAEGWTPAT